VVGAVRDLDGAKAATERVRAEAAPRGSFDLVKLYLPTSRASVPAPTPFSPTASHSISLSPTPG
jgi:hypothetical protein